MKCANCTLHLADYLKFYIKYISIENREVNKLIGIKSEKRGLYLNKNLGDVGRTLTAQASLTLSFAKARVGVRYSQLC